MRCSKARNLFSALYDGELDARRGRTLRHHLESCRACADEYARYQLSARNLDLGVRNLASQAGATAALWSSVRARLEAERNASTSAAPGWLSSRAASAFDRAAPLLRTPAAAAATAVVVIACLALALSGLFSAALRQPITAMIRTQTRTMVAFTVRRTEDGKLWTDARSRKYVLVLDASERWLR